MNIGTVSLTTKEWTDLEDVITGLSLTADTAYTLSAEGKGRICNSSSEPTTDTSGFPLCNEKFGYTHAEGKLYVLPTGPNALIINIPD